MLVSLLANITYNMEVVRMIKSIVVGFMLLSNIFVGTAENTHFIKSDYDNTGYFIEQDFSIHQGDKVVIYEGEVYVVECNH